MKLALALLALNVVFGSSLLEAEPRYLLPSYFEPNVGQFDSQVRFRARGAAYDAWITDSELILALPEAQGPDLLPASRRAELVRIKFGNRRPTRVQGVNSLSSYSNYFIGNQESQWRRNVPHFTRATLEGVYPGVDIVFYFNHREIEYDFIVKPYADPGPLSLRFPGAPLPSLDSAGDVILKTDFGELRHRSPVAYQGSREIVAAAKLVRGSLQFSLGNYDHAQTLVIDPVLSYSTYFGGNSGENGFGVAADATGHAYVVGHSFSSDLPLVGPYQPFAGDADIFVAKFAPNGTSLIYSTYIGGSGQDVRPGIAIDPLGRAYIGGSTTSTNYPVVGAFQAVKGAGNDAFLTVLNAAGNALAYSSYLGASSNEGAASIAVGPGGHAFITGTTETASFPIKNAFQPVFRNNDSFIARFDPTATGANSLVYSSFLGGAGVDQALGLAVGDDGSAYVVGHTTSTDFPIVNPFQPSLAGEGDVFVTKVTPSGSAIDYSTYLGGSNFDSGFGIAVDAVGAAYVTGGTTSPNFPLQNPIQSTLLNYDAFVSKLSPAGNSLVYSSFLGGSETDQGHRIAVQNDGAAYIVGFTESTNFPAVNRLQAFGGGCCDAFVSKINPAGTAILFSSSLGGSNREIGRGLALDGLGGVYVVGDTWSGNFPMVTPFQGMLSDGFEAFVTKIADQPPDATAPIVSVSVTPPANGNGWHNGPVVVSWVVSDTESAVSTQTGCSPVTLSSETSIAGTTLTCSATSVGGTTSESVTIKIDLAAPVGTAVRAPLANSNGWNNTDVLTEFSCADALSGIIAATSSQTITTEGSGQSRSFICSDLAGNLLPLSVLNVNIDKTKPVVTPASVVASPNPVSVNSPISLSAGLTDSGSSNLALAEYRIDGGPYTTFAAVSGASATALGSLGSFSAPAVLNVCARATDNADNQSAEECTMVAVYDPTGSFVTGAGTFQSPVGALTGSTASGRAQFAFQSKYLPGANVPSGNTQFKFKAGNFEFDSTVYEWLVVAGSRAQYKGDGVIKGQPGTFNFMLTAIDGDLPGGGADDKFRLKITGPSGGVYDNQLGGSNNDDPTTVLDGGSIVIHK